VHVKTKSKPLSARNYVTSLAASGRHDFASSEARCALGVSAAAAKLALNRLAKQAVIASPARGFYVIIPPEYRSLGCLPADQFIPALMKRLGLCYYAGLLSAAEYHGAAHHRPQEFQVLLAKHRRPIKCGAVRVAFVARKRLEEVPIQEFNTARGRIRVSTPEATAIDLVGYHRHVGGLDQVATILLELAEKFDRAKLVEAAKTAPLPWAQRLGYLLERVGSHEGALPLKSYVRLNSKETVPLLTSAARSHAKRDHDWKLYVNADVRAEL
jgi:predicted transcriptional regulator of viral defense system